MQLFLGNTAGVYPIAFSADGTILATTSGDLDEHSTKLWDVRTGTVRVTLRGHTAWVTSVAFSPDGSWASGGHDNAIKLWGSGGRGLRSLEGHTRWVTTVAFSPDGKTLASGSSDHTVKLWDVASGKELKTLKGHDWFVDLVAFPTDGKTLASVTMSTDGTVKLWDVASGSELRSFASDEPSAREQVSAVVPALFQNRGQMANSPDGRVQLVITFNGEVKLFDIRTRKELAKIIAVDDNDWAVVRTDGLFDASTRARKLMHWMVGSEYIDLEQLKERYYEPGLLNKLLQGQALRDVSVFDNPPLYPDIKYHLPAKGKQLSLTLTNRRGGIGRVQVFVNGKEFLADARDKKLKQNPNVAPATLNIDLSKATGAFTGKDNDIKLVAWNVENYISSRGTELVWRAGGPADRALPEVYAIIGGISNYAGSHLNLNFAAKDALDLANAIELGAKRLFGADKVHLTLLSTAEDPRAIAPTKDNFTRAFEATRKAKPTDILIVYLAGHGITLQRGSNMYCYLTQEARTTDSAALSDSAVRKQQTITSEELVDWIKLIPALKQVVMLDTCAAGAAQAQLRLVDKREASGDAIRAIDRAKDRTGSYILMGSAADAVSYEASQYGQGLLTYALLKGMKGAALRNDEFVDVSKLFQYARDEVEQLAKNIGGIQRPIIFTPKDDSFEVGQLRSEDKQKIALATPRPMILRPRFSNAQSDDDTLALTLEKVLRARLRDESALTGRGAAKGVLVFVDDEEFPGGIRPTGRYTTEGNKVTVSLRLRRDGVEIANTQVIGTKNDVAGLAQKILEAMKGVLGSH